MTDSHKVERTVMLAHPNGLHLTPIQSLVKALNGHAAAVTIEFDGKSANAKSTMDLMLLGATCGANLNVEVSGEGAEATFAVVEQVLGVAPES